MTLTNKIGKIVLILILVGMFLVGCNTTPIIDVEEAVSGTMTALAIVETEEPTNTPVVSDPLSTTSPTEEPTVTEEPTLVPTIDLNELYGYPEKDCTDKYEFHQDVTLYDGTYVVEGRTYTKTWRFRNIGTCTWTTDYYIMSSDSFFSAYLESEVKPGQIVDISIDIDMIMYGEILDNDEVRQYFNLYDDRDVLFPNDGNNGYNIGDFKDIWLSVLYVSNPVIHTVSPKSTGSLDHKNDRLSSLVVGSFSDRSMNKAFAEFSLHGVQPQAKVISAFFTFPNNEYVGNPWKYGCVGVRSGTYLEPDYKTLFNDDYYDEWSGNSKTEYIEWCSTLDMATHQFTSPELTAFVRKAIKNGNTNIQFKFTFGDFTGGHGLNDYIKMNDIKLWIISNY